jgi:undecaprenyl pyrophosphate phosphatase UppP
MIVGMVAAALSGFAAIWVLLRYLRTHDYSVFALYRFVAAGIVIALIASGALPPDF